MLSLVRFFFNDTATTEIYTLSLHDALPIYLKLGKDQTASQPASSFGPSDTIYAVATVSNAPGAVKVKGRLVIEDVEGQQDRKSTRLNSSHANISYAVFCLKKKKYNIYQDVR